MTAPFDCHVSREGLEGGCASQQSMSSTLTKNLNGALHCDRSRRSWLKKAARISSGPLIPQAWEIRLLCGELLTAKAQCGCATVAFQLLSGTLANSCRSYDSNATLVEPLVRGNLDVGANPKAARECPAAIVRSVWFVPLHLSE